MAPLNISGEVFEKSCQLGSISGDRGSVWIGKHKPSSSRYVLKIYNLEKHEDELDKVKDEIAMVRQLQHRNVIKYLAAFTSEADIWIIMPLIGYTSASRLVASHFEEGLCEAALALIMKDVVCGLHYIHSKGIIHRSIKGTHILVDSSGRSILAGFRSSTSSISQGKWEKRIHSYPSEAAFNLNWASPELLKQDTEGYCEKTDIYSLGVTVCELGNGQVPYCQFDPEAILVEKIYGREPFLFDVNTCRQFLNNGKDSGVGASYGDYLSSLPRNATEKRFTPAAHAFVSACLTFDQGLRPSAGMLQEHPFIRHTKKIEMSLPELLHPLTPIDQDMDLSENEVTLPETEGEDNLEHEVIWDLQ